MPELPEVETIRLGLSELIIGKTVRATHNYDSLKSFPNAPGDVRRFLVGARVISVRRRAKVLLVDFSSGYTLMCHMKMTGQLVFTSSDRRWGGGHPSDSLVRQLPDNTTRQHIDFTDGSRLYFNDLRRFGWLRLYPTTEVRETEFMRKVGPEPLEDTFTGDVLHERLQRRKNTAIKAAILDQTVVAGVGNIYADEVLWQAKIHPATLVRDASEAKVKDLTAAIKEVMTLSIAKGGSTDRNYVDAEGKKGSYLSFANVFRREGQPCKRCGTIIIKIRCAGRGTHLCPHCQKLPNNDRKK